MPSSGQARPAVPVALSLAGAFAIIAPTVPTCPRRRIRSREGIDHDHQPDWHRARHASADPRGTAASGRHRHPARRAPAGTQRRGCPVARRDRRAARGPSPRGTSATCSPTRPRSTAAGIPPTCSRWRGERVQLAGYRVQNLDCIVFAQRPQLGAYKQQIRQRLAEILGISAGTGGAPGENGQKEWGRLVARRRLPPSASCCSAAWQETRTSRDSHLVTTPVRPHGDGLRTATRNSIDEVHLIAIHNMMVMKP